MWESLEFHVFRVHEIVGSNPTILTELMRWVLCWYGKAAVNRPDAGSIPAAAAQHVLVEQPGVLACLSRRRSWVQIPSGTLLMNMARYANPAERRISNVRGCGFDSLPCYLDSNMRRLGIGEPNGL